MKAMPYRHAVFLATALATLVLGGCSGSRDDAEPRPIAAASQRRAVGAAVQSDEPGAMVAGAQ